MAEPNDESQQLQGVATGSQQQDEGSIAQNIMNTVMQEQAYQDLNAKLSTLEQELAVEKKEKEEAIASKTELAIVNAQLEEANKRAQNSYVTTSSTIREYETRIRLLEEEKAELAQDRSRLLEKSKNDDNLVSKYKEKIDSDTRQIRQLDIERNEAELAKNKFQHQNNVLAAALDIAQKDVEVYTKALMEKETEFSKYRTDSYLELQKAMSERDRESQARAQAESSERILRAQYQVNAEDLKKAHAEIQDLKSQLGSKTSNFKNDASFLQQRVDDLQKQSRADRRMVDELEQAMREEAEQHALAKAEMQEALDRAISQQAEAQSKMQEMAKMVELLGADRKAGTGGSVSATADLALALQGGTADSRTVRQALADAVVLQGEVERLQKENVKLEAICRTVLQEINERKPALDRQRAEWEQMKVDCAELAGQLAETTEAKTILENQLAEVKSAQSASEEDNKVLQRQVSDLSLQLRNILRQLAIRDDPALAMESFDPVDGSIKDESDIDLVITNSLVMFNKLPELLELNKRLLRMTRSLGQELEKKEKADDAVDANGHLEDLNDAANVIQELTRRIQDLEADIREHDAEVSLITQERDMFSRMLVQGRLMGMSLESLQSENNTTAQGVLRTIRAEFDRHREDLQKELSSTQTKLDEKANELREEGNKLADALSSLRHEQSQNQMLLQKQAQDQAEIASHMETIAQRDVEIRNLRLDVQKLSDEINTIRQEKASVQAMLDSAAAQRKILEANEKALSETVTQLTIEKARLDRDLGTRQLVADQEIMLVQQSKASVEAANASLRQDLENTRNALSREQTAHRALLSSNTSGEELRVANERIAALERSAKDLELQHKNALQALQAQLDAQKSALEAQKADIEAKTAAAKEFEAKAANANAIGLKYMRAMNEYKNTTVPNLKTEHEKAMAEIRSSVESLTTQLAQTKTQLEAAQRQVSQLQDEVASRDARIATLQVELTAAATKEPAPTNASQDTTAIRQELDVAQRKIVELEAQVSANQSADTSVDSEAASALQAKLQAVSSELESANKKIGELQAQLTAAEAKSQETIANLQNKLKTAEEQNEKTKLRVQELETAVAQHAEAANTKQTASGLDEATAGALKALQAEYDQYKETQTEKFNTSVSRVNAANKKLMRDARELKFIRGAFTEDSLESKIQEVSSPAELAQKVREAMLNAATRAAESAAAFEDPANQPKEAGVQTETATYNSQMSVSAQTSEQPLSQELEQLKKQLEDARALAESRAQEARAADEKAKKLAVKANQADKLKALTNDLKTKLAELQAAKTASPMLSVKGGAATAPGTSSNPVNVASTTGASTSNANANSAVGPVTNASEAVSVRGRGTARGTATRARGRGAARGGARGINPQAILSQVESSFRAADPAANTMQVKRPAPADSSTSGNVSDEASKRAKLDDQKGGQDPQ
ncbi:hypothetical protein NliqN6_2192 [Naganishia liquefaciens]|uniref:NUA/TPR/MLP1-2-like domain-containing protein n=1 Tax=Naganishia liquefaciens TaxID=104408 RepID=A0A8H3TRC6_9TREE|nr:hypothetical protein NliqN6_2192 [Naganishia liquefaciens]